MTLKRSDGIILAKDSNLVLRKYPNWHQIETLDGDEIAQPISGKKNAYEALWIYQEMYDRMMED